MEIRGHKTGKKMTAIELNAQIWRDIAEIADSESLMRQLAKYLKRLTAKKYDPTLMTKEEFMARIEKAEAQYANGEYSEMLPGAGSATKYFVFEGETAIDGVAEVPAQAAAKGAFNLAGQAVSAAAKGIVIVDGVKVVK